MGYLDNAGVTRLWAKMKAYVDSKLSSGMPSWKYLNECVLGSSVDISTLFSNGAQEVKVIFVYKGSTSSYLFSEIQIPLNIEGNKIYMTGYYYSSSYSASLAAYVKIDVKKIEFNSSWSKIVGGDNLSTAKMQVYYR